MDLIDRREVLQVIDWADHDLSMKGDKMLLKAVIKSLPSAQPEIIRCKDCKHYDNAPCGIVDWWNSKDDFCSKAERRD